VKKAAAYVPNRGDLVWLDFDPQAGHEQAGRRPAMVLSPTNYNQKTGLMICCPVTNQAKGYPFEVSITPLTGKATGVALSDQVRCLDWRVRNASKFAVVTPQCSLAVSDKIRLLLP
jgi:mRNA interferase MazF